MVPKGARISLIAALSEKGYEHYELFNSAGEKKRGVSAEDFRSFILDLVPKIPRNSVIILDNCKIHHAEILQETWKMIKGTYGIDHFFLPPYSPFLNPIELSFNTLKIAVKSKDLYNRGDLVETLKRCIPEVITSDSSKKWFQHCFKFYQQCAIGLPFSGRILDLTILDDINSQDSSPSTSLTSSKPSVTIEEM